MKKYFLIGAFLIMGLFAYNVYSPAVCFGSECGVISSIEQTASLSSPKIIQKQLNANLFVLIDVREDEEWAAGHISGAKHIPLGSLNIETTRELPKDKPIYLYCRSGKRAGNAEIIMKGLGFEKAKGIGGIIEWQQNKGELVQ
jgi:rhodanese-related sulfurtransferase